RRTQVRDRLRGHGWSWIQRIVWRWSGSVHTIIYARAGRKVLRLRAELLRGLVLIADPMPSGKEADADAAAVLRAIPGHVVATRIRGRRASCRWRRRRRR